MKNRIGKALAVTVAAVLLTQTGCAITPGKGLVMFPVGHDLLDSTKAIQQSMTEPQPLPRELEKRPLPSFTVEPGDVLLLQPVNLESQTRLPGDQTVLLDGTIDLGRYGRIIVMGQTLAEVETTVRAQIQAQAKDGKDPGPINARVVSRQSKVYYVLGEVNSPGAYPLNGRETVLDAILAGGGLNGKASRRNIIISRPTAPNGCRIVLPICYHEIVQLGDTSTNYQIMPGDRVFVPTRTFLDSLPWRHKQSCPPCGRPQVGCPAYSNAARDHEVMPPPHSLDKGQPEQIGPSLKPETSARDIQADAQAAAPVVKPGSDAGVVTADLRTESTQARVYDPAGTLMNGICTPYASPVTTAADGE